MVVDEQYYGRAVDEFFDVVQKSYVFDESILIDSIKRIYAQEFNVKTEIDEGIFRETLRGFDLAVDAGFKQATERPDSAFVEAIKNNNAVFAAFRTHRMQNDIASKLLDESGKLRSFGQFAKEVQPIANHNVRNWLQTEYNTAVRRAHLAADWKRFEENKDILPNLRWVPSTSVTPGADHKPFWNVVLPVGDSFWAEHSPGDRWNCKCSLEATDEQATKMPPKMFTKNDLPNPGLENNPAKDAKIFSEKHPYIKQAYKGANKAVASKMKEFAKKSVIINGKEYGKDWVLEYEGANKGGYIVAQDGHGSSELAQNIKSAKPLADAGRRVELIKQERIRVDGKKKSISTRDSNVDDQKWEFKYTEDYKNLSKSIGTKAAQSVEQGADYCLVDIVRTKLFSVDGVIEGVYNSFHYNKKLQGMCVMIESSKFVDISRRDFHDSSYKEIIQKMLESIS